MINKNYRYVAESASSFMSKVYGWMGFGLALTAAVAYWVASTPAIFKVIVSTPLLIVTFLAQMGIVIFLGARIRQMDYSTAVICFSVFSFLMGLNLSTVFLMYTSESIALTFAITSGMFLSMALYGYFTSADLTSLGSYLTMALFGLMISMLVNMWFKSPVADYYMSLIGVAIFTLFTAYDVHIMKKFTESEGMQDSALRKNVAIYGALTLYLDFINLFLYLLRFFGKKRND